MAMDSARTENMYNKRNVQQTRVETAFIELERDAITFNPVSDIQSESSSLRSARLLVVDDRRDILYLTSHFIKTMGGEVVTAENGEEALAIFNEHAKAKRPFDLVLMDVQMPTMDGLTAIRILRSTGVTLPVIALTANAMDVDETSCLQAGFSDYVSKPIHFGKLLAILQKYL
jgi:CheY-like chemotaxis protein